MADEQPTPDWIAQLDQANASVRDLAKLVRGYYVSLLESGFTGEQALPMTMNFQQTFIAVTLSRQNEET